MPSVANGVQADTTYSNFGSTPPTFNESLGYGVTGSLAGGPGTFGAEFTVPGVGNAIVTGADVALQRILTLGSNGVVDASFWTVSAGLPGTQVGGSFAATATDNFPPEVASLSISGVTLTGGQSYFLILTQFGLPEIDARLPARGLALGALYEAGGGNGAIDGAAAALFVAGIAARTRGKVLWCLDRPDLFAPALPHADLKSDRSSTVADNVCGLEFRPAPAPSTATT